MAWFETLTGFREESPGQVRANLTMEGSILRSNKNGRALVNNPLALQFWQRNGYRIVSEPKLYPDGTTAVDFRKDFERGG